MTTKNLRRGRPLTRTPEAIGSPPAPTDGEPASAPSPGEPRTVQEVLNQLKAAAQPAPKLKLVQHDQAAADRAAYKAAWRTARREAQQEVEAYLKQKREEQEPIDVKAEILQVINQERKAWRFDSANRKLRNAQSRAETAYSAMRGNPLSDFDAQVDKIVGGAIRGELHEWAEAQIRQERNRPAALAKAYEEMKDILLQLAQEPLDEHATVLPVHIERPGDVPTRPQMFTETS